MKVVRQMVYKCEQCGEVFVTAGKCKLHEKEEHKCPKCKYYYRSYGEQMCSRNKCKFEPYYHEENGRLFAK